MNASVLDKKIKLQKKQKKNYTITHFVFFIIMIILSLVWIVLSHINHIYKIAQPFSPLATLIMYFGNQGKFVFMSGMKEKDVGTLHSERCDHCNVAQKWFSFLNYWQFIVD